MKTRNKKGVAPIVATMLLIVLVLVLVATIWVIVNNLVEDKLGESEACFGIFEKVNLNSRYTCYYSDSNKFQFSINIEDVDVDEILVGISAEGTSVNFKINKTGSEIANLVMYSTGDTNIILPSKNAGLTYVFNMTGAGFSEIADSITIAPIIKGTQCSASDSIYKIDRCTS